MKLHLMRSGVAGVMAVLFFYGVVRTPLADAIALSFIAPLIALYLAAVMLGETIGGRAILASLLGLAGVAVIAAARLSAQTLGGNAAWGIGMILFSAVLYAWNLILQRRQALLAGPTEVAAFQAVFTGLTLSFAAPWLLQLPSAAVMIDVAGAAVLATISLMLISWGYGREETQVLLPLEYSAFIWAALTGWVMFGEELTLPTIAGAALIVTGCLIAARKHTEQTAL